MLFAPNVALKPMALAACAISIGLRIAAPMLGIQGVALDVLTPFALDALGIGALLALMERECGGFPRWLYWIGALTTLLLIADSFVGWSPRWLFETLQVAPMAALVAGASHGFKGILGRVFDLAPLRYLGRISYGIYLYHLFVLGLAVKIAVRIGHPFDYGLERTVICTAGTIAVAALSWALIEAPANRLKRRFPLSAGHAARQETEQPEPGKSYGR
jgi:peptidoglycan/LPS O-acetylase OafA/YrhL